MTSSKPILTNDSDSLAVSYSYEIKAYRAIDHPEICGEFELGQRKILESYGLTDMSTLKPIWIQNPNVWMIVANEVGSDEIVGGVRVHVHAPEWPLPLQDALSMFEESIDDYIGDFSPRKLGETSGLWNARSVYGRGLSPLLARCAVIVGGLLGCERFFSIVSHYTLDLAVSLGFVHEIVSDGQGWYPYPTEKFKTYLTVIRDMDKLNCATPEQRKRILDVRENPLQQVVEHSQKKHLNISYNLGVGKKS